MLTDKGGATGRTRGCPSWVAPGETTADGYGRTTLAWDRAGNLTSAADSETADCAMVGAVYSTTTAPGSCQINQSVDTVGRVTARAHGIGAESSRTTHAHPWIVWATTVRVAGSALSATRYYTHHGRAGDRGFAGGTTDTSGLTRIGARDYDPGLGGFATTDPVLPAGDPAGLNPYVYGLANPVSYTDRTGRKPLADGDYEYRNNHKGGWDLWTKPPPGSADAPVLVLPQPARGPAAPPAPVKLPPPAPKPPPSVPVGSQPAATSGWTTFWNVMSIVTGGPTMGHVLAPLAGAVATGVEAATGGDCYYDQIYGMNVCWGGHMLAARDGTTIGTTFVFNRIDAATQRPVDPRTLTPSAYAALMEHERNHANQWRALGGLMILYPLNEMVAWLVEPQSPGCLNFFEWSADWAKGGYLSC